MERRNTAHKWDDILEKNLYCWAAYIRFVIFSYFVILTNILL